MGILSILGLIALLLGAFILLGIGLAIMNCYRL